MVVSPPIQAERLGEFVEFQSYVFKDILVPRFLNSHKRVGLSTHSPSFAIYQIILFYASFILRNFGGGRGADSAGKPRQMWTSAEHAQKIAGGDVDNRTHGGAAAHPSPGQSNRCRRHLPYGETEDARNVWRQFHTHLDGLMWELFYMEG
jgi:hypothetical protein